MSKHLTRDLDDLHRKVMGMAARVEDAIYAALKSLQTHDPRVAREVIAGDEAIDALAAERVAAKKSRDFARADAIRAELLEKGIILEDTKEGTRWKRKA